MGNTSSQDIKLSHEEYQHYIKLKSQQNTSTSNHDEKISSIHKFTKQDIDPFDILSKQSMPINQLEKVYKKLLIRNHPDQGGNREVFEKIASAYKNIKKYLEYQENNKSHEQLKQNYESEVENNTELMVDTNKDLDTEKLNKKFNNDKFNQMYEKYKFTNQSDNDGYGDMIVPSTTKREEIEVENTLGDFNKHKFHQSFKQKKKNDNSVVEYKVPEALESLSMNFCMLGEDNINDYTDRNNNSFTDYKKAYSDTTLINVDNIEYQKFNTVEDIKKARENITLTDKERFIYEEQEKRDKEQEWQRVNRLKENDIRLNEHFNSTNQRVIEFLK